MILKNIIKKIFFPTTPGQAIKPALSYISANETIENAIKANLSVGDYVEKLWEQEGQSQEVTESILNSINLKADPVILEIGTGTGRYMEKLLKRINVGNYESYEVAADWNNYLQQQFKEVTVLAADGNSLSYTKDSSIDLVVAHGVFTYLPFLVGASYFYEIDRVLKPGGYLAFDCFLEDNFKSEVLKRWIDSQHTYPVLTSEVFTKKLLCEMGLSFVHTFENKYGMGQSTYLIFHKTVQ